MILIFRKKKILIAGFVVIICMVLLITVFVLGINSYVKHIGGKNIISHDNATELENVDCILVLGCQVIGNRQPSGMLGDRLKRGIELYKDGASDKIIMSGDHGQTSYDEVNTMKRVAIDAGIPSSDIFMDHAGFSTYESIYRAKEIFKAKKIIIVTQKYHLYRALYIAKMLGVEAYGVSSDYHIYWGQKNRDLREILARCKDFATTIYKPEPTYLGKAIPVSGNGDVTND